MSPCGAKRRFTTSQRRETPYGWSTAPLFLVERYTEIPWVRVRAIGNVIRHEYGEIESSAVWATISGNGLCDLASVANRELESLEH
jgi:uncharacterized protein with HEPN domain